MTQSAEHLLLHEVRPRLRNAIAQTVPVIGSDDEDELLQDGIVVAIHLLNNAKRSGKKVTAGNVAFYTIKSLSVGRRSTGYRKTDPLHPAARLSGRCQVVSLDDPVSDDEFHDEPLTLGEMLPSRDDDPATTASRRLDWNEFDQKLDVITKAILRCLANGEALTGLVVRFRKSRSTLQNHKERLARLVVDTLGDDILVVAQEKPGWRNDIYATRERHACRWERQTA